MIISNYTLLVDLVCILLLTTLTQTLIPFGINKYLGFFIFLVVFRMLLRKREKGRILILIFSGASIFFSLFMTNNISVHIINSSYWLIAIWLLYLSSDVTYNIKMANALAQKKNMIKYTAIVADVIILISLMSKQAYKNSWGEVYFIGYTVHQHTLASACCLTLSLALVELHINPVKSGKLPFRTFLLFAPALLGILESSARAFLIPAIILLAYLYLYKIKGVSLKVVLIPIAVLAAGYLFIKSNMFDRMSNLSGTASDTITSGRSVFWLADIRAFWQLELFQKLFGHGFEYVTQVNLALTGVAIGAHNDFITLALGVGLFGLFTHMLVIVREIKYDCSVHYNIKKGMLILFWLIPSIVNGFYGYQMLLYSYIFFKWVLFAEAKNESMR